jgi:cytoskeletal protein RodZ
MGKIKQNEVGFSAVEIVMTLVIVVLIGIVGYLVYKNHSKVTTDSVTTTNSIQPTKTPSHTTSDTSPASALSDNELITTAVKSYTGAGGSQQDATVTIDSIQGSNAEGRVKSGTTADDGFAAQFIAHKDNTDWQVVYEGQQAPGSEIGTRYNLPSTWYTH